MLAAISPSSHDLSQSLPYTHSPTTSGSPLPDSVSPSENKICPGCHLTVMDENGGVVIAFGQSFFHVDCFKCAKCRDRVTADTNLLLLSDGQPVCSNCSYSCSVCHQPILDEAIMTGDDSYHAHCFKCRSCHNRIDELMFAKTSHGIYCMKCHQQRVARSKRHAQKQKERESAAPAGSSSKSQGAPTPTQQQSGPLANSPTGLLTPDSTPNSHLVSSTSPALISPALPRPSTAPENGDSYRSQPQTPQGERHSAHPNGDERRNAPHLPSVPVQSPQRSSRSTLPSPTSPPAISPQADSSAPRMYTPDPSSPTIVVPPEVHEAGPQIALSYLHHEPSSESGSVTPFLTPDALTSLERRKSYDDGTRPLNVLFKDGAPPNLSPPVREPNRAGKRNSINPGTTFNYEAVAAEMNNKSISAPQSPLSFLPLAPDIRQSSSSPGDTQRMPPREQAPDGPSRRPSRKGRAETPVSAPAVGGSMLRRSQSRTESSSKSATIPEPMAPPPRHNMTLEHLPPRTHSLAASSQDPEHIIRRPRTMSSVQGSTSRRSTSDDKDRSKPGSLSIDVEKSRVGFGQGNGRPKSPAYKAASPSHKVDVPHGVESETESDGEREPNPKHRSRTPSLPSKDKEGKSRRRPVQLELDTKQPAPQEEPGERSFLSSAGDVDSDESSPVERVSRSTFIAPAHPPVRYSVSGNGFQELLSEVDSRNRSSLHVIEELVKISQGAEAHSDASQSAALSNPSGSNTQHEGRRSSAPADAVTATTTYVPSSVSIISAVGSQGHGDGFIVPDLPNFLPHDSPVNGYQRARLDSNATVYNTDASLTEPSPHFTVTAPGSSVARSAKLDPSYAVTKRLQDALQDAVRRGVTQIALDQEFVQTVVMMIEQRRDENPMMRGRPADHNKSTSQQSMDGLTVAYGEYDAELNARREAEAEVTRLRILLSGKAARITALSGQGRREELHRQLAFDHRENLRVLEMDVAKLKVERDVALLEMEEIASSRSSGPTTDRDGSNLSRALLTRLDHLKAQYKGELVSLADERESLLHEIAELQSVREIHLEETTMLNARNEELAHLNAYYIRRIEAALSEYPTLVRDKQSFERQQPALPLQPSHAVNNSFGASSDESADLSKFAKAQQKPTTGVFKWRGNNKEASASAGQDTPNEKPRSKHTFQQVNVLRLSKCDHCGEKLWGSQARCQTCQLSVHPRCQQNVHATCSPQSSRRDDGSTAGALRPVMFGRELTEQVRADARPTDKMVPLIVEKCIAAVEDSALDHEGIYRKNGGNSQSKLITQLFERGDYSTFDLLDMERFNDISSVTSVLKSYFRTLPNPLLTFVLHDEFMFASSIRDPIHKSTKYADLVKQLPTEHYYTLRALMLHLHRIQEHNETNLMTARNLGVVFGPTLMRSRNPGAEFSDMAGKALTIEWLVENAPTIFPPLSTTR